MRLAALIVSLISAAFFAGAAWLYWLTDRYANGDSYAVNHTVLVGSTQADGGGIFIPAFLLAGIGVFFAIFARNLWRSRPTPSDEPHGGLRRQEPGQANPDKRNPDSDRNRREIDR